MAGQDFPAMKILTIKFASRIRAQMEARVDLPSLSGGASAESDGQVLLAKVRRTNAVELIQQTREISVIRFPVAITRIMLNAFGQSKLIEESECIFTLINSPLKVHLQVVLLMD